MAHILLGVMMLVVLVLPSQSDAAKCVVLPDWVVCGNEDDGHGNVSDKPEKPEPPTKEPPEPPTEPPETRSHHQPPGLGLGHDNHDWDHKGKGHDKQGKGHGETGRDAS